MFARYFKQVYKFPLHKTPTRNISFLKNLLNKKPEEAPQQTQAPEPTTTAQPTEAPQTTSQQVPPPTENPTQDAPDISKLEELFKSGLKNEQELAERPQKTEEEMFPEIPKTRSAQLQEKIDDELDLPYKLYGNQAKAEAKV